MMWSNIKVKIVFVEEADECLVTKKKPHHLLVEIDDGVFLCLRVKNRYIPMIILIL